MSSMIEYSHVNTNYSDFAYRLEEFFQLIKFENQKLTKLDALLLYSLIRGFRPTRVLEIGRAFGTSTMTICGALCDNDQGHLDSVDIEDNTSKEIKLLIKDWATEYVMHSSDITKHVHLKDQRYQVFFIDGDHSLRQQIIDIDTCMQLQQGDGWIILHDANLPQTPHAVAHACSVHPGLVDAGRFGDQIHLLRISSKSCHDPIIPLIP